MRYIIARNAADGKYTKKFVARDAAEVGRDSTAAVLRATNFGVDTRCNSDIARNIAPCIRTLKQAQHPFVSLQLTVVDLNVEQQNQVQQTHLQLVA